MEQFSDSLLSPPVALAMLIVSGILIVGGVAAIIAILTRSRTSITQQAATEEAIPETPQHPPSRSTGSPTGWPPSCKGSLSDSGKRLFRKPRRIWRGFALRPSWTRSSR